MKVALALISILAACAGPTQHSSEIGRSHVGEVASAEATTEGVPPKPPEENATPAGAEPKHIAEVAPDAPVELEVPGFGPALVVLPDARSRPARILVGAHGAGDSPEWQCDHWGKVARGGYFVLCPRGTSLGGGGYYFKTHIALEAEFVAALAAVKTTYGAMVRPNDGVYTGYSQGATMGALMIVEHGAAFPHLVLVEGVALVCGGSACARRAEAAAKTLASAGLRARAEHVPGGGHTYVGAVGERATELLEHWLLSE
jgi:predicted esterase